MEPDWRSAKRCRDCGKLKPATEFWRRQQSLDGLALYCKVCFGLRNAASYRGKRAGEGKKARPYRRHSEVSDGMKYCPQCKEVKPLSAFGSNRSRPSRLASYCRPCHNFVMAQMKRQRYGSQRNYLLRLRYGRTEDQVDETRRQQGDICVICLQSPAGHVDHDHQSGAFRGLLCFKCNGGLGQFQDDPHRLRMAVSYLNGWLAELRVVSGGGLTWDEMPLDDERAIRRRYKLWSRYGIGDEEMRRRIERQGGRCLICLEAPAVHIDHDHHTGAVRGILCPGCNTGMGQLRDDPVVLLRAADYLDKRLVRRAWTDDGSRLSFTVPDIDPTSVPFDGWAMHQLADARARRALAGYVMVIDVRRGIEFKYYMPYPRRRHRPVTFSVQRSPVEGLVRGRLSRRS